MTMIQSNRIMELRREFDKVLMVLESSETIAKDLSVPIEEF